eukprot:982896-Lingulodinium_polyedra.AAC.1
MGLSNLRDCDQRKVRDGNALMHFSFSVMSLAHRQGMPCSIENPSSSRLWIVPHAQRVWRLARPSLAMTHMCQWGARWMKPTT